MVSTIIRGLEYPVSHWSCQIWKLASQFRNNSRDGSSSSVWISDLRMAGSSDCTKKHYAAIDEDRRRMAASAVKLRE